MAYAKALVARELLAFLEKQDAQVEAIRKQIDTPEKNYAI